MRLGIAAVVGASLALLNSGCPSTFGCDPPSKKFTMEEDLSTSDVASIIDLHGFADASAIDCESACTYKFQQTDGWETSTIDSCSHDIDPEATESPAGHVMCAGKAIEYFCEGRRPLGWEAPGTDGEQLVDRLVQLATLEAASVASFEQLADRLHGWRAPPELIERCRAAADDERRHARAVSELARRRGWTGQLALPPAPGLSPDLVAEALHNAVEGCVAETWAALLAHVRARRAADADVRECYERIAEDETRHAQLAWDLHEWFCAQLDHEGRSRVQGRRRQALRSLPVRARRQAQALSPALAGLDADEAARLAHDYARRLATAA